MNLQLAEQHKLIIERGKSLLQVALNEDKEIILQIINNSQLKIDNYNEENSTVIDATKIEIGLFKGMVKKIIEGKYINPSLKLIVKPKSSCEYDYLCDNEEIQTYVEGEYTDEYYDSNLFCDSCKKEHNKRIKLSDEYTVKVDSIVSEFKKACDSTVFSNDLKSRSISLSRSIIDKYYPTELQKNLKKQIHKEVFVVFEQQNKELILKYGFLK